jgi:hypothetical protein
MIACMSFVCQQDENIPESVISCHGDTRLEHLQIYTTNQPAQLSAVS